MKSTATAVWNGSLKEGRGTITAGNGAFVDTPYNFGKRFEGATGAGTTPEEMIAAAHSGCFAMAFSGELGKAGFTPERLTVKATVTIEPVDGKATVSSSHLDVTGRIPGIDAARFDAIAADAKTGCPISRLLNTSITLAAKLDA
jgi:osmotically inducible protein OsmC